MTQMLKCPVCGIQVRVVDHNGTKSVNTTGAAYPDAKCDTSGSARGTICKHLFDAVRRLETSDSSEESASFGEADPAEE